MHNPSEEHMEASLRVLRYLKSSPGRAILFSKNDHLNIIGYTDTDWAGNLTDIKSTSGYFTFVGENLVTWKSKKQNVVALSSVEAEFKGMSKGLCEILWIKGLLKKLGYPLETEIKIYCDNKAEIIIANNQVQRDRTKHVEVDRHFIKQKLDEKTVIFSFVKSEDQLANILTKTISSKVFHYSLNKLDIQNIFAST
jgi:hypothetical protein